LENQWVGQPTPNNTTKTPGPRWGYMAKKKFKTTSVGQFDKGKINGKKKEPKNFTPGRKKPGFTQSRGRGKKPQNTPPQKKK